MQSTDFYRQLVDHISTALVVVSTELRVDYINSAAQALLESSESRCLHHSVEQLFPDQNELVETLNNALNESSAYTSRDLHLNLSTGHEVHVDVMVTPYHDLEGSQRGLILEILAVDRLQRISREENLIFSQETTRALVRGLAHEVKNPLGGIRGAAQLLARELPEPAMQEYTNIIIKESDRLRDLVDRLLGPHNCSRMVSLNIHEILEHVRSLVNAEAGDLVQIERDYDPSLPDIFGDRPQLIQAVLNVVRNAMQATETNDGPRTISMRTRVRRQFTVGTRLHRLVCQVDITDNGAGVPHELEHSLFVPMVSGRADGTGLGLAISQSIINQHQGLIECSCEPGCTKFTLYIPMEAENA